MAKHVRPAHSATSDAVPSERCRQLGVRGMLSISLLGALAACGGLITIDETKIGKLEIEPVLSCEDARAEGNRLIGVHMRQTDDTQTFETLSLTGNAREARLPRTLDINDAKTRLISTSDQEEGATRPASAAPRAFFSDGKSLPAVYDLSYRSDKVDYAGPLVVGNSAVGLGLRSTGRAIFRGKVQLSQTEFLEGGTISTSTANAVFAAVVGYGSGQTTFTMSQVETTSGDPLPFESLEWRNLGICGARIASTGQGTVRLLSEDGRRVSPFSDGRSLPVLLSNFESLQFQGGEPPSPPGGFGGLFSIESDKGTLVAVFLSDSSP